MTSELEFFVYIKGIGSTFPVNIEESETVGDLKKAIWREKPNGLKDIDASRLVLYEVDLPDDEDLEEAAKQATKHRLPLKATRLLSTLFPTGPPELKISIVVEDPKIRESESPTSFADDIMLFIPITTWQLMTFLCGDHVIFTDVAQVNQALNSELVKEYKDIFIDVSNWGDFEDADIHGNHIVEAAAVPQFVTEFEKKLESKPTVAPDLYSACERISGRSLAAAYDRSNEAMDIDDGPPEESISEGRSLGKREVPRQAQGDEMSHVVYIMSYKWPNHQQRQQNRNDAFKGRVAQMIFFGKFYYYVQGQRTITAHLGHEPWPFDLIVKCETEPGPTRFRKYTPRSAFLLSKSRLPRLLVEVDSTPRVYDDPDRKPVDLVRILLAGAAVVRFANKFLESFKGRDFVLVAVYITSKGEASRYTIFQDPDDPNSPIVYYNRKVYSFVTSDGRIEFARQLYNLHYMLEGANEGKDTEANVDRFKEKILKHNEKFSLKSMFSKGTKRNADETEDGASTSGSRGAGAGSADAADHMEFRAHGYEVEPEVVVDNRGNVFEPLVKMPSHILNVYRRSNPKNVLIAKKVREESNEIAIFNLLDSIQSKSKHIISPLDSFHISSGTWLILPRMSSLADYVSICPDELYGAVAQVCQGLIEGLAYLHRHYIAHRDIKPDNLLVDRDLGLKIIDFDIAMQVKDENEKVDDRCGTKHWMAPEIGKSWYSPIKADRWSCGHVILHLLDAVGKEDNQWKAIARRLEAHDPDKRPSLLEWPAWFAPYSRTSST
ncbi:hypothetical protein F5148DRAFT_1373161 [Russula earlei]|uniref:Uncharacterized protein n=1 Tax=Russula earlei TaxID=71964 RepID=A0ACC0ULD6_9AGAM|nr:hypothetical protein F5148DRAFT_1373161 [Russula earlei]